MEMVPVSPAPSDSIDRDRSVSMPTPGRILLAHAGTVPEGEWGGISGATERVEVDAKFSGKDRFACTISGFSCFPALLQSDLSIWDSDRTPACGSIVLAQRESDRKVRIKTLQFDDHEQCPLLMPVNPSYGSPDGLDGWEIIGKLLGVMRNIDGSEVTWYSRAGLCEKHLMMS